MKAFFIVLFSMLSSAADTALVTGKQSPATGYGAAHKAMNEDQVSTIILLRHAEKDDDDPKDPSLSEKGEQRAQLLARLFQDVQIDAFYATPYKRTKETIGQLAQAQGREVQLYDPADKNALAEMVNKNKGKKIVIAGHSNTIPHMVNILTGKNEFSDMAEYEFGKIWLLVFKGDELIDQSVLNY